MFARARRPPRSMAGCCALVTRATPAVGRRAAGPVKAAAPAARATMSFIFVKNTRMAASRLGALRTASVSDLVCLLTLVSPPLKVVKLAYKIETLSRMTVRTPSES